MNIAKKLDGQNRSCKCKTGTTSFSKDPLIVFVLSQINDLKNSENSTIIQEERLDDLRWYRPSFHRAIVQQFHC
jgi:hypothetical protein